MSYEDLLNTLRKHPFEPFRIHLTDGHTFEVHHPDLIWVGQRVCLVGHRARDTSEPVFDRYDQVSILHITRLEPIPEHASA
jgi:hypothetical protein